MLQEIMKLLVGSWCPYLTSLHFFFFFFFWLGFVRGKKLSCLLQRRTVGVNCPAGRCSVQISPCHTVTSGYVLWRLNYMKSLIKRKGSTSTWYLAFRLCFSWGTDNDWCIGTYLAFVALFQHRSLLQTHIYAMGPWATGLEHKEVLPCGYVQ